MTWIRRHKSHLINRGPERPQDPSLTEPFMNENRDIAIRRTIVHRKKISAQADFAPHTQVVAFLITVVLLVVWISKE